MRPANPIRVVIADDHPLARVGLRCILEAHADIKVVGEADGRNEAVSLARRVVPDVVVIDLMVPRFDGIRALRHILADRPGASVLVVTAIASEELVVTALGAGAMGFLLKSATADELVRAVHDVACRRPALGPRIVRRMVASASHHGLEHDPDHLTDRETEVLAVLARGHSNQEIGAILGISPATVRTHLTQVFAKLGLARRAQAMLYAFEHGIARPDHISNES